MPKYDWQCGVLLADPACDVTFLFLPPVFAPFRRRPTETANNGRSRLRRRRRCRRRRSRRAAVNNIKALGD